MVHRVLHRTSKGYYCIHRSQGGVWSRALIKGGKAFIYCMLGCKLKVGERRRLVYLWTVPYQVPTYSMELLGVYRVGGSRERH